MRLSEFDYHLPEHLIAQTPLTKRDDSRLLVLNKKSGETKHKTFIDIIDYIKTEDLLIFNDTKVSAYRLFGKKSTGAKVECLITKKLGFNYYEAIVSPGRRLQDGSRFILDSNIEVEIESRLETGERKIRFLSEEDVEPIIKSVGQVPLPPYIHQKLDDYNRYQTVYAHEEGSIAAPTAGLHFTTELIEKIKEKGTKICFVTLHVGIATFRPIRTDNIDNHIMHSEDYFIPKETVEAVKNCKGKIIAVGTTSTRALETAALGKRNLKEGFSSSQLFIKPGFDFKIVDGLVTNFHIPKSSLLLLVSALSSKENIFKSYQEAIERRYRFFSFGDAMLII